MLLAEPGGSTMTPRPLDLVIKNVRVVRPRQPAVDVLDLGVQDGRFARVAPGIPVGAARQVFDGRHLLVQAPLQRRRVRRARPRNPGHDRLQPACALTLAPAAHPLGSGIGATSRPAAHAGANFSW